MFENFPATFIDWRWGSLLSCLRHLSKLHTVLVLTWESRLMRGDGIDDLMEPGRAGEGDGFKADDQPDVVGNAIDNPVFWSYLHMLMSLGDSVSELLDWLQGCSCHPSAALRKACRVLTDDGRSSSGGQLVCPMRGWRMIEENPYFPLAPLQPASHIVLINLDV